MAFSFIFSITFLLLAFLQWLLLLFSGATHDIACDGVYMAELNKEEQAKYIGVQGAFYNVAKLVANGGLVAMAGALAEYFGAIEGASLLGGIYIAPGLAVFLLSFVPYLFLKDDLETKIVQKIMIL